MITELQFLGSKRHPATFGNVSLKSERDGGLGLLHDQMGKDEFQDFSGELCADYPDPDVTDPDFSRISHEFVGERSMSRGSSELLLQLLDQSAMAHGDFDTKNVTNGLVSFRSDDGNATVSIEKTGKVFRRHDVDLSAYDGMVANSGELRCPAREGAEGQSRAKQSAGMPMGVCNEHVPPAKAKMCSELHGNMQRATEMIAPAMTNKGTVGTSTKSRASNKSGDRQCPTGRAYFLRNDDTYFMVDPRFLFKWTGDLTYPDQMAFTRLCGLRFFMKTDRRMFQAVIDGVTA